MPKLKVPDESDESDSQNVHKHTEHVKEATYMFKLNSCASSPCLTDLLRSSIKQGSQETVYDPVTKLGTVSQLYLQIVSPRGSTEAPEMCVKRRNLSISDSEASSDSGVAFRGSLDDEGEDDLDLPLGAISRTHTMPDLSSISCT